MPSGHLASEQVLRPRGGRFRGQSDIAKDDRDLIAVNRMGDSPSPGSGGGMNSHAEDRVEGSRGDVGWERNPFAVRHPVVADQAGGKAVDGVLLDPVGVEKPGRIDWPAVRLDPIGHAASV